MKKQTMLILASLIFLFPEKTQGQWQIAGKWPYGACNTVIADSDYIYIGNGGMIIIADNKPPIADIIFPSEKQFIKDFNINLV